MSGRITLATATVVVLAASVFAVPSFALEDAPTSAGTATVSGTVVDLRDGAIISGVTVSVVTVDAAGAWDITAGAMVVGADGRFELEVPGETAYAVYVATYPLLDSKFVETYAGSNTYLEGPKLFYVGDGEVLDLEIPLTRYGRFSFDTVPRGRVREGEVFFGSVATVYVLIAGELRELGTYNTLINPLAGPRAPGDYYVVASWRVLGPHRPYPYADYFPSWQGGAPLYRPDLAQPIVVLPDQETTVVIPLQPFFDDMLSSVFADDIFWMQTHGITQGCSGGSYCTNDPVTRAEMAAFLVRALGLSYRVGDVFRDDDGSIFESDIEKLAAAGITQGCNPPLNDEFCPEERVTRGQMAAFLARALGLKDDAGVDAFVDDDWSVFEDAINRLAVAGITNGCNPPENDRYCPYAPVTRGEMAAFLRRALG